MNRINPLDNYQSRRQFFASGKNVLGGAALASLLGPVLGNAATCQAGSAHAPLQLDFAPKAKRVIYLHMVGGPSQMD